MTRVSRATLLTLALATVASMLAGCSYESGPAEDGAKPARATAQIRPGASLVRAAHHGALHITLTDLGTLGGPQTVAYDFDDVGGIVGVSETADGQIHGYRWRDGQMVDTVVSANGVNSRGQVAGGTEEFGVIWTNGTLRLLGMPPASIANPITADLNDHEEVVGYSQIEEPDWGPTAHATIWRDLQPIDIGTLGGHYSVATKINNRGQVIGYGDTAENQGVFQGFVWERGVLTALGTLGGLTSMPNAINPRGQIVGVAETATGELHAFLWTAGTMLDLGTLGGSASEAVSINEQGDVVGNSTTPSGETHAFFWRNGKMTDLGVLGGDFTESRALCINNRGQIVGTTSGPGRFERGVLWQDGTLIELPLPGAGYLEFSEARYIDNRGNIYGRGAAPELFARLFLWTVETVGTLTAPEPAASDAQTADIIR